VARAEAKPEQQEERRAEREADPDPELRGLPLELERREFHL
jgi:hypothetical protein